ncbi:effector-associated constant component EACC1 [Streptomyces sp. CA-135486]|uniref:effector-associated constant component EACC1 n=1 Tax=Streptomyces sp. CA-135486 TaxID=3240049 RepID=UPI003D8E9A45
MDLIISLPDESAAASLARWLLEQPSVSSIVPRPPQPGIIPGPPQIQVFVASASELAPLGVAIRMWLLSRMGSVQLTIEGPSGQVVTLTDASPDDAAELSRVLAAPGSQQRDESITTPDGHTSPGPPLDPDDDWPRETPER